MKTTTTKKEKKTTKTTTKKAYLSKKITAENIIELSEQTAKRALNTIYAGNRKKAKKAETASVTTTETASANGQKITVLPPDNTISKQTKSNDNFVFSLIKDLQKDIKQKNNVGYIFSNAYDIVQTASVVYSEYIGKKLNTLVKNGETDKNGNAINIYTYCLRVINRYILSQKSKVFKTVFLDDISENKLIQPPKNWDMPTITDYKKVIETIKKLNLSVTENKVLYARLRGLGCVNISKTLSISEKNVFLHLSRIQKKYNDIIGQIETQTPKTVIQAEQNKLAYAQIDINKLTDSERELLSVYRQTENISATARQLNKTRQAIQNALKKLDKKMQG